MVEHGEKTCQAVVGEVDVIAAVEQDEPAIGYQPSDLTCLRLRNALKASHISRVPSERN